MKKILTIAGGVALLAGLGVGTVRAQTTNEIMRQRINNLVAPDAFGCPTACTAGNPEQPCNLWNRIYGDKGPNIGINSPAITANTCEKDGYALYNSVQSRTNGDGHSTANYPAINSLSDFCEAWYSVWDGVTNAGLATFITYYGAGSTLVNQSENGDGFCQDCSTACGVGTIAAGVCFGALGTGTTTGTAVPNTPQGIINPIGGLAPIPIVTVTSSDVAANTLGLGWGAPTDATTVNRPSSTATPCPASGSTFNDLTASNAPSPIRAMRLFVHTEPGSGDPRSLSGLEGGGVVPGTSATDRMGNTRDQICFDTSTCAPGLHVVHCTGVSGGVCHSNGMDFMPQPQSIVVSETAINAALGLDGPVGTPGRETLVFNTKLVYAGATETASSVGNSRLNPKLVSLFSANSPKASFGGLVSGVQFDSSATRVLGNRVTVSWTAVGTFSEFRLSRSFDGVSFTDIATIPATGEPAYRYTDEIRGRSSGSIFYRVVAFGASGETQALTEVSLRSGGRR